ncbi:DUF418 domain-containing protein [Alkaliphilus pronyensis]|uniref:DUF418 domain-containing protein n=1 Tax=Alkaliphilus pronyensis TaxID=1482732 RepID=A0A6I0F7X3_9FIRM|nr:DUF418 domain-containing protein [Alkaliphilus pronyensis]KAB3539041.1 DUF418 domain-containing protein [Alkaliphilus pronyensis]
MKKVKGGIKLTNTKTVKPVSAGERIKELDIVRGFALFGVLLVNIAMFNSTLMEEIAGVSPLANPLQLTALSDKISSLFIQIFAEGKFYTIFSFLFGLGFYIFMDRAEAKTNSPRRLFARRSFFLFLFGMLNFTLVWFGDILHAYGIIGFLLILFKNCRVKTIRNWMIALLSISIILYSFFMLSNDLMYEFLDEETISAYNAQTQMQAEESLDVYGNGSFIEVVSYRLQNELSLVAMSLVVLIPKILGMFLIGFYVGKRKIFEDIKGNLGFIKKVWKTAGIVGLLSTLVYVLIQFEAIVVNRLFYSGSITFFSEIATVFLSLFYITSLVLLYHKTNIKSLLMPLSYMGQMALTNYLVQCILCSILFYGYGFGLLNKANLATGILITIIIYIGQIFFSKAWLSKYKYGPFEWVWRYLTYGGSL